jgi:hypothetical protein
MSHLRPGLRPGDWIALLVSVLAVVMAINVTRGTTVEASLVTVEAESGTYIYSLDEDRNEVFAGPLGYTAVEVAGGAVRIVEDPGPLQLCVRQGAIRHAGEWLACLPNRVFLRIDGDLATSAIDGLAF